MYHSNSSVQFLYHADRFATTHRHVNHNIPHLIFSGLPFITMSDFEDQLLEPEFVEVGCCYLSGLKESEFLACESIEDLCDKSKGRITSWDLRHFPDAEGDYFYDCHCIVCDYVSRFGDEPRCHSCDAYLEEDEAAAGSEICQCCVRLYFNFCSFCHRPIKDGVCQSK